MTSLKSRIKQVKYFQSFSFFVILLISIFILEGFGLSFGRTISFYTLLYAPFLLYIFDVIQKKTLYIPRQFFLLYGLFLIFTFISVSYSVDIQRSFEYLVLNIAIFLLCIYAMNHEKDIKIFLPPFIFVFSFLFITFSIIINIFQNEGMKVFIPSTGYQLVFPVYGSHNHLGDFLILPLLYLFYLFIRKPSVISFLLFLLIFPHVLFSYSRSAYMAVFITATCSFFYLWKRKKIKHIYKTICTVLILVLLPVFLVILPQQTKTFPIVHFLSRYIPAGLIIPDKDLTSNRFEYLVQASKSIKKNFWFGIGPDNFRYVSIKYGDYQDQRTDTSHNLFIDTLVENGIFATLLFILFIINVFRNSFNTFRLKKQEYFVFLLAGLFLNFQTDYTFKLYSFLIIFFMFIAFCYKEEKKIKASSLLVFTSLVICVLGVVMAIGQYEKGNNVFLAQALYPFQKDSYKNIAEYYYRKNDTAHAEQYIKAYGELFSGDFSVLKYISRSYLAQKQEDKALYFLDKAYQENKYMDSSTAQIVYNLTLRKKGEAEAKRFAKAYISFFLEKKHNSNKKYNFPKEVIKFCHTVYGESCLAFKL